MTRAIINTLTNDVLFSLSFGCSSCSLLSFTSFVVFSSLFSFSSFSLSFFLSFFLFLSEDLLFLFLELDCLSLLELSFLATPVVLEAFDLLFELLLDWLFPLLLLLPALDDGLDLFLDELSCFGFSLFGGVFEPPLLPELFPLFLLPPSFLSLSFSGFGFGLGFGSFGFSGLGSLGFSGFGSLGSSGFSGSGSGFFGGITVTFTYSTPKSTISPFETSPVYEPVNIALSPAQ